MIAEPDEKEEDHINNYHDDEYLSAKAYKDKGRMNIKIE